MAKAVCPERGQWNAYLLGKATPQDAKSLQKHLKECPACLAAVGKLKPEDTLLEAMRTHGEAAPVPDPDIVNSIVAKARTLGRGSVEDMSTLPPGMPGGGEVTAGDPDGDEDSSQRLTDFLKPAKAAGELGWLGTYRVLKLLGQGGMGVVFEAEDQVLHRRVALKVMTPELARKPESRKRFLREARAVAAIEHDHIVPIYQVGEAENANGDKVPFLAMQLLRGESLADRLKREKKLPIAEVLRLTREIAAGLAVAHDRGLIHRDIKPANLWLEASREGRAERRESDKSRESSAESREQKRTGPPALDSGLSTLSSASRIKIVDFGLARQASGEGQAEATLVGTPAFMAPEQIRQEAPDPRTDLFALGCVIYQMLTGRLAFQGSDALSTMMAAATDTPKPVRELRPDAPPELVELVDKLMAKNMADRPDSARDVIAILDGTEQAKKRAARRRARLLVALAALIALIPVAYFTAPTIYRFITDQAEIVVETDDKDVQIVAKKDGQEITILDTKSGQSFLLTSGEYTLTLKEGQDGLQLSATSFTLKRGGTRFVTVTRIALADKQGEFVFHGDGMKGRVRILQSDQEVALVDLEKSPRVKLSAGAYQFRLTAAPAGQRLAVHGAVLTGGGSRTIDVIVVGEVRALDTKGRIYGLALSQDGRWLLAGSGGEYVDGKWESHIDAGVRLIDVQAGAEKQVLRPGKEPVRAVHFSPDAALMLAAGDDQTVWVWKTGSASPMSALLGAADPLWCAAFTPDGKGVVAGDQKGMLHVWDVGGPHKRSWQAHKETVRAIVFTADGKAITAAGGQENKISVWNLVNGREESFFEGHSSGILALAMTRESKLLSAGKDGNIVVWDVATGKELRAFAGHKEAVQAVAVTPDGRRAFSGSNKTLILWDVDSAKELHRFDMQPRPTTSVAILPDARRAFAAGWNRKVQTWGLPVE